MIPPETATILIEEQVRGGASLTFTGARDWVVAQEPEEVPAAFQRLREAQQRGLWAAGFLSYELGYALEPKLLDLLPAGREMPLMLFGLFESPLVAKNQAISIDACQGRAATIDELVPGASEMDFKRDFRRIKSYIAAGDTYQINHTFPLRFRTEADPRRLYNLVRFRARGRHGAYLDLGDLTILSGSPELFLERSGDTLVSRPMKGTAPRGRTSAEDERQRAWLAGDQKSRAENLMILDLIRNDLGRVAETGTVSVRDQFAVETYPTLHQMTSTASCRLKQSASFEDVIRALFPCGSITGAPKIRSMEIIRELEREPRGVYTGSIGYIAPNGDFSFNVAIRTAVINSDGGGVMGVGSGIVWDSDVDSEYRETLLKSEFLTGTAEHFDLFETLRWSPQEGFYLLAFHLDRMQASAAYFEFPFERQTVLRQLQNAVASFPRTPQRVKVTVNPAGHIDVTAAPFRPPPEGTIYKIVVSPVTVNSADPFLFHKTTRRQLYDSEYDRLSREMGADEVLFLNEHRQVVEGSRTNVFVEQKGVMVTPPVTCGLLPGCLRRSLLEDPTIRIEEKPISLADLYAADKVYVGNSLRGIVQAEVCDVALPQAANA